jgi:BlaI family penicillinase repressor
MDNRFSEQKLSRRERQIMHVVYRNGSASVADIIENIPDAPSPGAVRRMLNILEQKGILKGKQDGPRKVYFPTVNKENAQDSALDRVVETFFGGSAMKAMASLFEKSKHDLSKEETDVLSRLIERAEEEGR